LTLHRLIMEQAGTTALLRDLGALESAVAQPRHSFAGDDLYPTLAAKAGASGFSLIQNHPFLDGNKRVGHAAIVAFLRLNGQRLVATVDEAERIILGVASGELSREEFVHWIKTRSDPSEESGIT
jgi:death-on-curing protein